MIELDYAFLADYAIISGDKLTAVGASYTFLAPAGFPLLHNLAVAGRVRCQQQEDPIRLGLEVSTPGNEMRMRFDLPLQVDPNARPYGPDRRVGVLFVAQTTLPIHRSGLYEFQLSLNGEEVRRLAFECLAPEL